MELFSSFSIYIIRPWIDLHGKGALRMSVVGRTNRQNCGCQMQDVLAACMHSVHC
jgi:hypothetical protein